MCEQGTQKEKIGDEQPENSQIQAIRAHRSIRSETGGGVLIIMLHLSNLYVYQ